jgi:hypothetical protein
MNLIFVKTLTLRINPFYPIIQESTNFYIK